MRRTGPNCCEQSSLVRQVQVDSACGMKQLCWGWMTLTECARSATVRTDTSELAKINVGLERKGNSNGRINAVNVADQATVEEPVSGQPDPPAFCINYLGLHFYSSVELFPFGIEKDRNM